MNVDNTKLFPITEQEREKLMKKGLCFCCQEKGHQSRNCPRRTNGRATTTKINKAKVSKELKEKDEESGKKSDLSTATMLSSTSTKVTNVIVTQGNLFNALKSSSKEERAKLMERIIEDKEEDF
jgi:hypothetical protein